MYIYIYVYTQKGDFLTHPASVCGNGRSSQGLQHARHRGLYGLTILCMHVSTCICVHIYIYIYIYICTYLSMYEYVYIYIYIYNVSMYIHMYLLYLYKCIYMYLHINISIYQYVYVSMYVQDSSCLLHLFLVMTDMDITHRDSGGDSGEKLLPAPSVAVVVPCFSPGSGSGSWLGGCRMSGTSGKHI